MSSHVSPSNVIKWRYVSTTTICKSGLKCVSGSNHFVSNADCSPVIGLVVITMYRIGSIDMQLHCGCNSILFAVFEIAGAVIFHFAADEPFNGIFHRITPLRYVMDAELAKQIYRLEE